MSAPAPEEPPAQEPIAVDQVAVNPTSVATQATIGFAVNQAATVTVRIVDGSGRVVRTVADGMALDQGVHSTVWDRRNDAGRKVRSGAYAVVVEAVDGDGGSAAATARFEVVDAGGGGGKRK